MAPVTRNDARINVRITHELKQTIEEAASALGQSVSEFAISTVVREARQVLQNAQITRLSNRDRDRFLEALDAVDIKPNMALKAAPVVTENSVADPPLTTWTVEPFDRAKHDRSGFDCGIPMLNEWLTTKVSQFYERHGFLPLTDDPRHLFLPMTMIRKLQLPPL